MDSIKAFLRYRFDRLMAQGLPALIGLLALVTMLFVLLMSILVVIFSASPNSSSNFGEVIWDSLLHALDPGTIVTAEGSAYRTIMLLTTIGGLIVVAGLIGVVSGAFNLKIEQLRKGRSRVLRENHTLILGWNSRIFSTVSELVKANLSERKSAIVILTEGDKVELLDLLKERVGKTYRTKVIVRTGDPTLLSDLEIVNHSKAKSVIILADDKSSNPDLATLKIALALINNPNRSASEYHIVAEIQDLVNLERARLISSSEVSWVLAGDVMSRIMVQTSRQSGLSQIFLDLLNFDGDEIYITREESLVGLTYLEAQHFFTNSSLIGVLRDGRPLLNPPSSYEISSTDQLVVIAPDDSLIKTSSNFQVDTSAIAGKKKDSTKPERILILGQNENLPLVLSQLALYVPQGSQATVVAHGELPSFVPASGLTVDYVVGDPTSRRVLESLNLTSFNHIMVLADRSLGVEESDALTLLTLLQLRSLGNELGRSFNVVSEMLSDRNRELAESTEADDFIVSDQLIGLLMSQISENKSLANIFQVLFSPEGSEISLKPASLYVKLGETVDMHTLIEAAAKRGETAIGFRKKDLESSQQNDYGIALNPEKVRRFKLVEGDKVIVLAEG